MNLQPDTYQLQPIGIIHTPFSDPANTPIQFSRSNEKGEIAIDPEYEKGLQGIEDFSHLILLYVFHKSQDYQLLVKPFLDDHFTGIFTCRHPQRPNHLGLSVVKLLSRKDNRLLVQGVDMLDGTPIMDIKPYVADFDQQENVRVGWYSHRDHP